MSRLAKMLARTKMAKTYTGITLVLPFLDRIFTCGQVRVLCCLKHL